MAHNEIYLARHGETHWNRSGHYQGQLDSPLTTNGENQARAIGRLIAKIREEKGSMPFYCSPLGRCRQTANLISEESALDSLSLRRMVNTVHDVSSALSSAHIFTCESQ